MHFWIDKRSQQCGFGRSRVAASLSGASGSGFGFGHPPRRVHTKKMTTSTSNYSTTVPIHRQHHHHSQQQQTLHGDYCRNVNCNSNGSHHQHQYRYQNSNNNNNNINSNNNNNNSNSNNSNSGIMPSTQILCTNNNNNHNHSNSNNNNNNFIQLSETEESCTRTSIISTNNNNNNNSDARHSILLNDSLNRENILARNALNSTQRSDESSHYDTRNYYHPQFGNMSVRHYQSNLLGSSNVDRLLDMENSSYSYNALPSINGQLHIQQQQHQQITQSSFHSESDAMRQPLRNGNVEVSNNVRVIRPSHNSNSNMAHHHYHSHTPNTAALHSMSSVDNQLLPTHLKCGMCASLVLASVFVAGVKFYFDHQGTGLEVLIFCAFCATFFLAACTASLCKVPKILLPQQQQQQRSVISQPRHNRVINCNLYDGHNSTTINDSLSISEMIVNDLNELQECTVTSSVNGSTVGPPPYHIAILLPETKLLEKVVTSSTLSIEESPPPSYDKILV